VPIELIDTNGEVLQCCLEILLDVTNETSIQLNFEEDLKHIISILFSLVAELKLTNTDVDGEIYSEAISFQEYLDLIKTQLESSRAEAKTRMAAK
jgi:hypothetical protein